MNVLIDTGPIVAMLNKRDAHHNFADAKMRELEPPFYTCEAVITESFFLLKHVSKGATKLIELIESGKIEIPFSFLNNYKGVHQHLEQYSDLPSSFADACLVQMYETTRSARIFTVDHHFHIYRDEKGNLLSLIISD